MLTIREPGGFIENTYDDAGRVVRQVAHLEPSPDRPQPQDAIIALAYTVTGNEVTETDVTEYDGTHTIFRFNARHYADVEIHDARSAHPMVLSVDRDPVSQFVIGLTVRCTVDGRRTTRTLPMTLGLTEEQAKAVLLTEACGSMGPVQIPVS